MKRVLYLLSAIFYVAVACTGSKENPEPPVQESLTVSPASLSFSSDGTQVETVTVTASSQWTASASNSWIQLGSMSGKGNGSVQVTAAYNASAMRTGKITFKLGKLSREVAVTQAGDTGGEEVAVVPAPAAFDGKKRSNTAYQILIYAFNDSDGDGVGDFKGIQQKLDYLDEMGVTALWLSPAHPSSSYHGYDVNDYYAVNPLFGTEQDFQNLISEAAKKGIAIYMDYVLNHSGKNNAWFKEALANPSSPYRDYYFIAKDASSQYGSFPMLRETKYVAGEWKKAVSGAPKIKISKTEEAVKTGEASWNLWYWKDGSEGSTVKLVDNGDGTYYAIVEANGKSGVLVRKDNSWSYKFGVGSDTGPSADGTPYALSFNGENIYINGTGRYKIELYDVNNIEDVYYMGCFSDWMPDLNYGDVDNAQNNACFKDLAGSADKWIRMGIGGLRLDAVKHISGGIESYNNASNITLLKKWYEHCDATYKALGHSDHFFMVAEAWLDHYTESQYYQCLPSNFEFDYGGMLSNALNQGNGNQYASRVIRYITDHTAQRADAITSLFLANHDQDRWAEWVGRDLSKQKQAAAMLLTSGGKPFIYMGEELGYGGKRTGDTDIPRRMPMAWDASLTGLCKYGLDDNHKTDNVDYSIVKGSVSVATQKADASSLWNVYKSWSQLRNTYPALSSGTMSEHATLNSSNTGAQSIAAWYMTSTDGQKLLVIHNVGAQEKKVTIQDKMTSPIALLGSASVSGKTLKLGPNSSVVFEL